jgi:hypothetical protein
MLVAYSSTALGLVGLVGDGVVVVGVTLVGVVVEGSNPDVVAVLGTMVLVLGTVVLVLSVPEVGSDAVVEFPVAIGGCSLPPCTRRTVPTTTIVKTVVAANTADPRR